MNRFVCDVWVSTQCSLDKMLCVCSQLPGAWELFVSPSLSDEAVSGEDEDEWAVMSLSLVLAVLEHIRFASRRPPRVSAAAVSCAASAACCAGLWRARRPFTCFSWQRFFLAAMATEDVSLSECERRDFLPAAWTGRRHFFRWRERVRVSQVTGGGRRPQADGGIAVFLRAGLGGGRGRVRFLRLPGGWVSMKLL